MGSSDARKERRKRDQHDHSPEAPTKKAKINGNRGRGRSEYRTVTRTAKRPSKFEQVEAEDEDDHEDSGSEIGDDSNRGEEFDRDDKGKAYDALLTLLNAEQVEDESESDEDEEASEVEELEDEEDDEEDDDEENQQEDEGEEDEEDVEPEFDYDSEDEDLSDPFEYHFASSSEKYLDEASEALKSAKKWSNSKNTHDDYSSIVSLPSTSSSTKYKEIPTHSNLNDYKIKSRLLEPFKSKFPEALDTDISKLVTDPMFSYKDVLFPYQHFSKQEDYRKLYSLHCLNHVFKTRDRIMKNNGKVSIQNEKISEGKIKPEDEKEFRDQGFTRPKVLILLPSRNHCYKVVENMISMSGVEQVEKQKRFKNEFFDDSTPPDNKPEDFRNLFEGNNHDDFRIGIKFTRKSMKLFSSFYQSDIILASPLGLQFILENPDKKKKDGDFLSSIEVLVVDNANAIELQNWDHVLTVLKHVNKIPGNLHDTDFGRVRMWSINDQAKLFRQTLVFTEYNTPNVNNLLSKSQNIFGKYRFRPIIHTKDCSMSKVGLKIRQIFNRFESSSPIDEPDARFNHFKSVIVPSLSKSTTYEDGLLIYIPLYSDFLRVKNYLHNKTSLLFVDTDEYTEQKDLTKARALFQQGRRKILLYSERLHHYRRFDLKGVKNIFMYGVPNNPIFYTELVSSIGRSVYEGIADFNISNVRILYSKWDSLAIERIVGSERAPVLTHGQNEFYEFR
ncbi:hypothetical protein BN7_1582 [Wickerhamomyces ciferrii]|uniref:U3 small nucleolar RNA-associated protein 25 n=1 Tax=Wickerhamomyces ciferrii (strain ATCC 14091 / BCRC 22168 / CBS 111 / JCM 3599 / NBRC 0793 / NRRL Y-1031 F-60-10) TaxID=1206466 RepID=K0KLP4_WICCF|nr:uncharacterized protein BN7_1582 [Wickerhamomyces ciferrii]CCH42043.1 hypothetical protein BN7_1582 [Wickerhamomyces ciferrii]